MEEDEINVWPMYTIPSVAILAQALEESDELVTEEDFCVWNNPATTSC